jgi:hypothetical protein
MMFRTLILATAALAATSASAQPSPGVRLPIAPGYYVWEGEACGRAQSIFRYDGRRAGWYGSRVAEEGHQVGDIRRVWRSGRRYVVQVTGEDAQGEPQDGLVEITVTLLPRGRILAQLEVGEDVEETPLRACAPASLPRWGRRF